MPLLEPGLKSSRLIILLLAFGSGCAALIYEIVWFQMLELVIGSSAVSLAVLLGTFMGGLFLGSLLLSRVVSAQHDPLRVYALLEIGIGVLGCAVLVFIPLVSSAYLASVGRGVPSLLLRGVLSGFCLLPPTVLMGATLPALGRLLETDPRGASWLGYFYASNTVGAVLGSMATGFYLLRVHDSVTATYVAAALNASLAVMGLWLAQSGSYAPLSKAAPAPLLKASPPWVVYLAIGISGLTALGAEVVWTRLLSLLLGPTVYTFSIVLACFLAGLGIGSWAGAYLSRRISNDQLALGWCQLLLMVSITYGAYMLGEFFPQQPHAPPPNLFFQFRADAWRCLQAIFPAACFWGASFPLAVAAVAPHEHDAGRLVGGIYAANTLGAIVGATATSLLFLSWLGTPGTQRLLIYATAIAAVLLFVPWSSLESQSRTASRKRGAGATLIFATAGLAWFVTGRIPPAPAFLIAYGRYSASWMGQRQILYTGEGLNASIAVSKSSDGVRYFHVAGKVEASSDNQDMRLQRMLGHLPALIHPAPRSVLIVGCGAGVTAGSFVPYPTIDEIQIAEIEPLIPPMAVRFFRQENSNVLGDPRLTLVFDDARHYLLTTPKTFDIITSDPIHPWVKGSAALYTKEYFTLVARHLNPGGVVSQWVPLYQTSPDVVKTEIATFFEIFPEGTIWSNEPNGDDLVLLGQAGPSRIDVDALQSRLSHSAAVAESLDAVGFHSVQDLLTTYTGRAADIQGWLDGAQINSDRNLRLQYLAGLEVDVDQPEAIYLSMLKWRKYPDDLFVGSSTQDLRKALEQR